MGWTIPNGCVAVRVDGSNFYGDENTIFTAGQTIHDEKLRHYVILDYTNGYIYYNFGLSSTYQIFVQKVNGTVKVCYNRIAHAARFTNNSFAVQSNADFPMYVSVEDFEFADENSTIRTSIGECTVDIFDRTFYGRTDLESVPDGIFDRGVRITTTGCFEGCTGLGGLVEIQYCGTSDRLFEGTVNDIFLTGNAVLCESIAKQYDNVHIQRWTVEATFNSACPNINYKGTASLQMVSVVDDVEVPVTSASGFPVTKIDDTHWKVTLTLDKTQVEDPLSAEQDVNLKCSYVTKTEIAEESHTALFSTTRNMNFSNGLANSVFLAGCENTNYTSRLWWSQINDPSYFPADNFVEVGSNDTKIMGLVKVGEYLGVVKQGRTTDTAVYLVYPTSYDEDTTYAVRQEMSGFGALAKWCFNILKDETLFLSEEGVMAIEPTDESEARVRDRSFFINGKMLKESHLEDAYSIVWKNMYFMAVPRTYENEATKDVVSDGVCYVLDGTQRNSWGNDKTNLVYECYYLENIPAKEFVKYKGRLCFTDGKAMYQFKDSDEERAYADENKVVNARWSTILDDDGSLHYYKTMQKKGNLVSILPEISENTKVYVRQDEKEPVLIDRKLQGKADIPSEMYINKKFKKYKRLQFIIVNDPEDGSSEGFGIDCIIKNYTLGNYSK